MFRRSIPVMLVLALFGLTQAGCADQCPDTTFRVEGVILHPEGGPIPNAVVEIAAPATEDRGEVYLVVLTDEDGRFQSDEITMGVCEEFTVGVTATRYITRVLTYKVPNDTDDAEVTESPLDELPEELEIVMLPDK